MSWVEWAWGLLMEERGNGWWLGTYEWVGLLRELAGGTTVTRRPANYSTYLTVPYNHLPWDGFTSPLAISVSNDLELLFSLAFGSGHYNAQLYSLL